MLRVLKEYLWVFYIRKFKKNVWIKGKTLCPLVIILQNKYFKTPSRRAVYLHSAVAVVPPVKILITIPTNILSSDLL